MAQPSKPFHSNEDHIEKSARDARGGFRGKRIVIILFASLALAVIAYLVLQPWFAANYPTPPR